MSEWKPCRLGDVCEDIAYGYTASANNAPVGPKFLRITDIVPGRVNWDTVPFCQIEDDKVSKYKLIPGDIVIARTGATTGYTYTFKSKDPNETVFASYLIRYRIDRKKASPYFIEYIVRSDAWKNFVDAIIGGSAQPGANAQQFASYEFNIPPITQQEIIASILSSLDDKIDLLHRQNKTLEAMAETVFRKWFIEDARSGWEEKGIDKIAVFLNGLACQKYPAKNLLDALPVIKIKELHQGFNDESDWASSDIPSEYIVNDGDVIFSWSGSLEVVIWQYGKGVLNQHLFKVTSEKYPKWFYYFWIKHHLPEFRAIAEDKATTMGHIQRHHLSEAIVVIPDDKAISNMNGQIQPLFDKLISNQSQVRKLENLRDTLLPKLMSGEARIKA